MTWDEESVLQAADTVGYGGALWILYLAEESDVGIGKTSNFHSEKGSVRSYAKSEDLDDPGISVVKDGFQNLCRKPVTDASGRTDVINNDDKNADLLRLSRLGMTLMKTVNSDDRVRTALKESIGIETGGLPDPWWPGDGPRENYSVYLYTHADHSVREEEEVDINAYARFECACCGEDVINEFQLTLENGEIINEWGRKVTTQCEGCDTEFEHSVANPHQKPTPL
ncbi:MULTISPECIES: hypothetical protein [Halobacteriales]|uniref:hypothetical protein n=1 Tax=Halobacteriales TaxID=2235 RepID=UPI00210D3988|nr:MULTISPECIES: hypothetical protein [Halobacteria]